MANWDEGGPVLKEVFVLVEDFGGAVCDEDCQLSIQKKKDRSRERGETYSAVNMYPGEMQFTRIPACAHSTANELAKCLTAAFAAL